MVIYQTLNEYSAAGLYDRSGLSMNMFLKIREYLVNEGGITGMSLNLEVEVDVPFTFDYEALAGEVVAFTIDHEGFPYEAEVNLTLTDNEGIHEINRMYRTD